MVKAQILSLFCYLTASMYLSEINLDLLPKILIPKTFLLIHTFLDQKTEVILISCARQFHVKVKHNLRNLNLVIHTSRLGHKKWITDKKSRGIFKKKFDQILRDLSARN